MGKLRTSIAAASLAWTVPALADPVQQWTAEIGEASARFGIPETWIRRVMAVESGGVPFVNGRPIVSSAGAIGLMQLMPGTWREMRARLSLGHDPAHPRDNILAGTAYLRAMYDLYGYPGLFAAYNAGPARYAGYLAGGRALPRETRAYVMRIAGRAARRPAVAATPPRATVGGLFVSRGASFAPAPHTSMPAAPRLGLFVELRGSASP